MKKLFTLILALIFVLQVSAQDKTETKTEKKSGEVNAMFVPPDPDPEEDTYPWNRDKDRDGYGDPNEQVESATQPNGYVADRSDCDDTDKYTYPGAPEIDDGKDNDCDGKIDEGIVESPPSMPAEVTVTNECGKTILTRKDPPAGVTWYWQDEENGKNLELFSKSVERHTGTIYYLRARDNNSLLWSEVRIINYTVEEAGLWYFDRDMDGLGNPDMSVSDCEQPLGFVSNNMDCDDNDASVKDECHTIPGMPAEVRIDNNCGSTTLTRFPPPDGVTWYWQDEIDGEDTSNSERSIERTSGTTYFLRAQDNITLMWSITRVVTYTVDQEILWYPDNDMDGYGNPYLEPISSCDPTLGYVSNNLDCDDYDAGIGEECRTEMEPPAIPDTEIQIENFCGYTRLTRESSPAGITWYWQEDENGESQEDSNLSVDRTNGTTYYLRARDNRTLLWSQALAINYTVDQETLWYRDLDDDGYGNPNISLLSCQQIDGYVKDNTDCFDANPDVYPGALEVNDDWDNNCDGIVDNGIVPETPSVKKIENFCGHTLLTRNAPPEGETWYWQSGANKMDLSSSEATVKMEGGTTYYLKARNNTSLFWSKPLVISYTVDVESLWYPDIDGDGYGGQAEGVVSCDPIEGHVENNTDCNDNDAEINPGATEVFDGKDNNCDGIISRENWNTIQTTTYDPSGKVTSKSKGYYNDLGRMVQNQSLDILTDSMWASQTMYDTYGRPALQTLSAPIRDGRNFGFHEEFIKKNDGSEYTTEDFESIPEAPAPVGDQAKSLGWYYSENNHSEPYQDVTNYPFSRTIFSTLNPGKALKTIGGNKMGGEWKNGYSFSMKAAQELSMPNAFDDGKYGKMKIVKTVVRDVHGVENVSFSNTDGQVLAMARSGGEIVYPMSVKIGRQGFVDIHVPTGSDAVGFEVEAPSGVYYRVYDLISEKLVTEPTTGLGNGFYRIVIYYGCYFLPCGYQDDYLSDVTVYYKTNYYDYSLNKYDKAGRLTRSYQPLNKLETTFKYNALGQLVKTTSPDQGTARFIYMKDGQIRFSQNSLQEVNNEFSYTNYDIKGRPVESGVLQNPDFAGANPDDLLPAGERTEQTLTVYDHGDKTGLQKALEKSGIPAEHYASQAFLAGNISKSYNQNPKTNTTWYSYDVYGRVTWVVQDIAGLGAKTIDYEYDPLTSQVTKVIFQKYNTEERYVHQYSYNDAGQLVKVETSEDGVEFREQVAYEYYETGALKRKELGGGLQGIDYVYNINGALKSINNPIFGEDPGQDKNDVFGMTLNYYDHDYNRIKTPTPVGISETGEDQFNGNIKGITWNHSSNNQAPLNYQYKYNRNNWLKEADFSSPNYVAGDYKVSNLRYDANGNLLSLDRNKNFENGRNEMDRLTYNYYEGGNRLSHVEDAVTVETNARDIKSQEPLNYEYNVIGQLVFNKQDGLKYVYNTSGLVKRIDKDNLPLVEFVYNDRGQRLSKRSFQDGKPVEKTHYVRDVSGNVMGIYTNSQLKEIPIYGNSRLGMYYKDLETEFYEITDHLGNVRTVIARNGESAIAIKNKADYYPFGMVMPKPVPNGNIDGNYRYAYQGQEKDAETGMEAFELRVWDSRIGRWLNPDPVGQYHSPYMGMGNDPILRIDPNGGTDCPNPPCNGTVNGGSLNEVIVDAPGAKYNNLLSKQWELQQQIADLERQLGKASNFKEITDDLTTKGALENVMLKYMEAFSKLPEDKIKILLENPEKIEESVNKFYDDYVNYLKNGGIEKEIYFQVELATHEVVLAANLTSPIINRTAGAINAGAKLNYNRTKQKLNYLKAQMNDVTNELNSLQVSGGFKGGFGGGGFGGGGYGGSF